MPTKIKSSDILNATIKDEDIAPIGVGYSGIADNKLSTIVTANKVSNTATSGTANATENTLVLRDGNASSKFKNLYVDENIFSKTINIANATYSSIQNLNVTNLNVASSFSAPNISTTRLITNTIETTATGNKIRLAYATVTDLPNATFYSGMIAVVLDESALYFANNDTWNKIDLSYFDVQVANTILAGPESGADDTPTFRALVADDLPVMTGADGDNPGTVGAVPAPDATDNTKFLRGDATWQDIAGTGTITSVGLSMPGEFVVSNSPVTGDDTLTVTYDDQTANTVFAGPATGADSAPTFRTLDVADLPALVGADGDNPGTAGLVPAPSATDNTKFLRGDATWRTVTGGDGGSSPLYIIPDFAVYESNYNGAFRIVPGSNILELAPNTSFVVTRANALTSPPLGFTVLNSGLWASADTHSTTQYRFRMVSAGGNTNWDSSTVYVPGFYRTVIATDYDVLVRIHRMDAIASDDASYVGVGIGAYTSSTPNNKHLTLRAHIGYHKLYGFPSPGELHLNGMTPQNALTDQEQQDGVWVHLRKRGQSFGLSINKTNSTTPPTTGWVTPTDPHTVHTYNVPSQGGEVTLVFFARSYFTSPAPVLEVSYLQERIGGDIRNESGPINWVGADGWPTDATRITLINKFDLGSADAVINDADIQAALIRSVNRRSLDSATWTFSAVRSSENPGADTYQAAGSVTVSGTGQYFGLFAEVTSTDRINPGSIDLSKLIIPMG